MTSARWQVLGAIFLAERLGDHLERVSYDSPIRSAEDIGATPLAARVVNVKPPRIGSLRALFDVYARCARERRPMYGGGMGELGVGRGHIELLAALFHADAPNDWRQACGVKKFDSAAAAVLVIAAEPVQTARRAGVFAVSAPVRPRSRAGPGRR